jgi:hypothetical protein
MLSSEGCGPGLEGGLQWSQDRLARRGIGGKPRNRLILRLTLPRINDAFGVRRHFVANGPIDDLHPSTSTTGLAGLGSQVELTVRVGG